MTFDIVYAIIFTYKNSAFPSKIEVLGRFVAKTSFQHNEEVSGNATFLGPRHKTKPTLKLNRVGFLINIDQLY